MARLMPVPLTVSCFSKIQIGFTFLVPARPGSPGQRAVKRVCVCVYVCLCVDMQIRADSETRHLQVCFVCYCRTSEYVKRGIEVVPIKFSPTLPLHLMQVTL